MACYCGHEIEVHGHDSKYPGSTACTECECVAYEEDDNDVRLLSLGAMLIVVGLLYFFAVIPAAAQGYGGPRMWGFDRPEAYEAPPCNARYNPDCGRFGWEGPRARQWRYERHPMMPDAPRGRGYYGPPRWDDR